MKWISYIISTLILIMIAASCNKAESPFEKSPSERTEWELEKYRFALQAREYWVVEYFPDEDLAYGGWVYVMKFGSQNRVQMWFEGSEFVGDNPVTESEYVVEQGSGPMLKFRTHNDYLHWFTFPGGPNGSGYNAFEGDFEFKIMSISDAYDEIILRGNRTGNTIRMYPLPPVYTPQSYVETVRNEQLAFTDQMMTVTVNGTDIGTLTRENTTVAASFSKYYSSKIWTLKYSYVDDNNETITIEDKLSVINLPGRIMKLYKPYVFEHEAVPYLRGNSMQTFQWQIGAVSPMDCYVCTDSFMEIQIRQ